MNGISLKCERCDRVMVMKKYTQGYLISHSKMEYLRYKLNYGSPDKGGIFRKSYTECSEIMSSTRDAGK